MDKLIARLENATEGSRELDAAVENHLHLANDNAPHYTTSLDDALIVVPKGWAWFMDANHILKEHGENHEIVAHSATVFRWVADGEIYHGIFKGKRSQAKSPALALLIASLKARQAVKQAA